MRPSCLVVLVSMLMLSFTGASLGGPPCRDSDVRATITPTQLSQYFGFTVSSRQNGRSNERTFALRVFSMLPAAEQRQTFVKLVDETLARKTPIDLDSNILPLFDIAMDFPDLRPVMTRLLREKAGPTSEKYARAVIDVIRSFGPKESFGPQELRRFLSNHPGNIAAALKALPRQWRRGLPILYDSESRQGASADNPRFIPYGERLAIAHRLRGGVAPEVIAFNDDTDGFELYHITEKGGLLSLERLPAERCARCHGDDTHPNWRPYDLWQGAVGAFDDRVEPKSRDEAVLTSLVKRLRQDASLPYSAQEITNYFKTDAQLQHLANPSGRDFRIHTAPNDRFGTQFNFLNFYRLLRLIRRSPDYCQYKYAIEAALEKCEPLTGFLPKAVRERHGSFEAIAIKSADDKKRLDEEFRQAVSFSPDDPRYAADYLRKGPAQFIDEERHDERVTALRYLFEGRGISMKEWSIDPGGHYVFHDGIFDLGVLRDLLPLADSDLYGIGADCATLKTKSLAALKELAPSRPSLPSRKRLDTHH